MKVYTPREAADELKVCEETVKRLLRNGNIKGFRVGNRWRIKEEEIIKLQEAK